MQIAITGNPDYLKMLFETAARAIMEEGSFMFAGISPADEDEEEPLTIDFESDPSYEGLEWEAM